MESHKKQKIINLEEGIIPVSGETNKKNNEEEKEKKRFLSGVGLASELGFIIAIPIAGGALLGSYLDRKLGTTPKCTLSLLFLGIVMAFYSVYKIIREL